jgi:integrase
MAQRRVYYVPEALDDYMAELGTLGLAANTVACYRGYLARFGRICQDVARERGKRTPLTVEEIDGRVMTCYFSTSTGKQGNLNNMLIPVRLFLTWCVASGWLDQGAPARLMGNRKYKRPERQPKYYIPAEDFPAMLEAPCLVHPSERMIVALALYTLGRRGEIGGLRLRDIDLNKLSLNVYRQKRKRWTEVAICPELHEELLRWLKIYGEHYEHSAYGLLDAYPDWHLIPRLVRRIERNDKGQISRVSHIDLNPGNYPVHMERLVKGVLDHLGVTETRDGTRVRHLGEGMHTVRRSGARAMLDHLSRDVGHERALLQVATMLDHDDPKQTLLYIGMDKERDDLNNWLRSNSMYGAPKRPDGKVIPIRRIS